MLATAGWADSRIPATFPAAAALTRPAPWLFWPGAVLAGLALAVYAHRRRATAALLGAWRRKQLRTHGVASSLDVWRSRRSVRAKAAVVRPSLATRQEQRRLIGYADPVATVGGVQLAGRQLGGVRVWSSCEDVTIMFGGPRMGKTQALACRVVDAPGPAVVTSTRTDLVHLTATLRSGRGPIHIFNPGGLGDDRGGTLASTLKWSPLAGCKDPAVAMRRAADMIPESGDARGERWDDLARDALAVLLHAAALVGLPMRTILSWCADPRVETSGREVERALARSPERESMQHSATQFFGMRLEQKGSVTMTMRPALRWLRDSRAAALGDAEGGDQVDLAELIEANATIYLLGEEDGVVGPLVAALTAEIARTARMMASRRPGGRLDPPLKMALDEAAIICRVPLHRWTADMGGRGVDMDISVQSMAQLVDKWGRSGAETVLGNCGTVLVFGGGANLSDYEHWSKLCGTREVPVENLDKDGKVTSRTTRREPVVEPADIANLPEGWVLVKRKGMRVSIGRAPMAWRRRDIARAPKFAGAVETSYEADARAEMEGAPGE